MTTSPRARSLKPSAAHRLVVIDCDPACTNCGTHTEMLVVIEGDPAGIEAGADLQTVSLRRVWLGSAHCGANAN